MYSLSQLFGALRAKGLSGTVTEAQVAAYIAAQNLVVGPNYSVSHTGAQAVATNYGVTL